MKRLIHAVSFCLLFSFTQAQPTLTSNKMLPPGSVMKFKAIQNFDLIDTTIQGANKTWNFSGVTPTTDSSYIVTIALPSQTPYGSDFPTANYAYIEDQYPATSAFSYFNLTSTKMERVGSWKSAVINTYTDPQTEYVFPLTLGVSNLDTWDNTNSSFGGNYNLWCIGYGTLILPGSTYTNALMVRVEITEGPLYDFPVYFWYSSANGAILFEYITGDGFLIPTQGQYIQSLSVGINEAELISDLRFNNPVRSNLDLSFSSKKAASLEFTVMNSIGEVVLTQKNSVASQQAGHIEFNFSGLTQGLYFLTIRSDQAGEEVKTIKLMKM